MDGFTGPAGDHKYPELVKQQGRGPLLDVTNYQASLQAIGACTNIETLLEMHSQVAGLEAYVKKNIRGDSKTQHDASALRIYAEITVGQVLMASVRAVGAMGTGSNQHEVRSVPVTAPTHADLGISKNRRKTTPGHIINAKRQGWIIRCGKQRIVSFH